LNFFIFTYIFQYSCHCNNRTKLLFCFIGLSVFRKQSIKIRGILLPVCISAT
jgi:hypothetical protein